MSEKVWCEEEIEVWKTVKGYTNYEVSSLGRVRPVNPRYKSRPFLSTRSYFPHYYPFVILAKDGKYKTFRVHVLVLKHFVGERPKGFHGAHLNGIRTDNRLSNLKWVTPKENSSHKILHGKALFGERHPCSKLKVDDVLEIRRSYKKRFNVDYLANKFKISTGQVRSVAKGNSWKYLEKESLK